MKARIEKDALRSALATVRPALGKTSLPVLSGVRLDAAKGLTITATDLQTTITAHTSADVQSKGSLVVSARLLAAFADRAPDGAVAIELDGHEVKVTAGDAAATFNALPVEEWPKVATASGDTFTLTAEHVDRIRRILPFVSVDEARGVIQGLHLVGDKAYATDSYRLGEATLDGLDLPPTTIPAPAIAAALKGAEGDVQVSAEEHRATISHGNCTWTTVLMEGTYPPVERLLRRESPHYLTLHAERMAEALGRMGVLSGDNQTHITRDGDKAIISAKVADLGEVTDVVPCEGDIDWPIGFNPNFLAALIEAAGEEHVTLGLLDNLKPATVLVDGLALLLMPTRKGKPVS